MALEFRKAQRKAVPMLISIAGTSGSGKTFSALLLARGLAGPAGRVGLIDAENGRGEMYTDSPSIKKAYADHDGGMFDYLRLDPPFSPDRYIEHLQAAEQAGITVCLIDSASHEWEGVGGACEIAEKNPLGRMPNWAKAKMAHKRFVNHMLSSPMHIILCLRARDKVKIFKKGDQIITSAGQDTSDAPIAEKEIIVPLGLQPITEKSLVFEALLSLLLDERTHCASPVKVPEPLAHLFTGKRLITKEDGEKIRLWNSCGAPVSEAEQLDKRAAAAASEGTEAYKAFFSALAPAKRKLIRHEEHKRTAALADQEQAEVEVPEAERPGLKCEPNPAVVHSVGFATWEEWERAGAAIHPAIVIAGGENAGSFVWNEESSAYRKALASPVGGTV